MIDFQRIPFLGFFHTWDSHSQFLSFFNADYPVSNGASFPLLEKFWGFLSLKAKFEYGGTNTWSFGTFLKSFIVFDLYGTLILGVCLGLIVLFGFKNTTKKFYFHQLFLYFLFFKFTLKVYLF